MQDVPPWSGRQWTAEEVAWNLERMAGFTADAEGIAPSAFQRSSMVQNIASAEAVDELTVKITLSAPNSAFFNGLVENRTPMMPREMVDIGFTDPNVMAGIGDSEAQSSSNFDGVSYVITATPDVVLEAISQFHTTGSRNYGEFSEPELDAILDAAIQGSDNATRTENN